MGLFGKKCTRLNGNLVLILEGEQIDKVALEYGISIAGSSGSGNAEYHMMLIGSGEEISIVDKIYNPVSFLRFKTCEGLNDYLGKFTENSSRAFPIYPDKNNF